MKPRYLLLLCVGCALLQAQTPPPAPNQPRAATNLETIRRVVSRSAITNAPPSSIIVTNAARTTSVRTFPAPPVPSFPSPGVQPKTVATPAPIAATPVAPNPTIIVPPITLTNETESEEIIPAGLINFSEADLGQVMQVYAEWINRTILRPATLPVTAKITLKNQTSLTRTEAIQALDAVFALNGVAMIKIGDKFVKAVATGEAQSAGAQLHRDDGSELPELGQYDTHIVQLHFVKPSELVQVLAPFSKIPNSILAIDSSQILVLRDFTENVKRMLELIKEIDVSVPSEFISEVIPIKYALAEDIASALNGLSTGGSGATIGSGGRSTGGGGRTFPGSATTSPGTPTNPRYPGQPGTVNSPTTAFGSAGTTTGAAAGGSATPSFSDRLRSIINKAAASGDLQILGQTKIIADKRTNSLLIFAQRQDMDMIKSIVGKLDVVLAQVLIETIIMDVDLNNQWKLGVSAGQRPNVNSNPFGGFINNSKNPLGTGLGFLNQVTQTTNGDFVANSAFQYPDSPGLNYFGKITGALNWDVLVQAAASDDTINVIQKPRIQTSHATPASIFVGSTVPYVTSTYYNGGFNGGPSSSYQQLSVGIGLNVTPFINPDGLVVMQIDETIDELSGSTSINGVGDVPNTTHRTLSAEVAVRDRETIILGGFIRNSQTKNVSGVPILKDIPLLGLLFTSHSSNKDRKELLVMMRPTVLRTPDLASQHVAEEKRHLPGITKAEIDYNKDEASRMKAMENVVKKDNEAMQKAAKKDKERNPENYEFEPVEGIK